ncbi:YaiO family outer membrane beta-barrel protein [Aquimarina brevivitae]|uniref:YaiO family outer membrane protein n=1 Tax=Aquimarina brevivitae TaxID=323412 RepID=A0A4Q7PF77_9FLAO|nr:YaiO family outer membrane beta-barrel protein [Aquimarina brevivitae]RZS99106.1 YaiO family outer membrane protein [Aquimarina brevivitae]
MEQRSKQAKAIVFYFSLVLFVVFPDHTLHAQLTQDTDVLFKEALSLSKSGNLEEALEKTNTIISLAPEYTEARLLRVRLLHRSNQNNTLATTDIVTLLSSAEANLRPEIKNLAIQHINHLENVEELSNYKKEIEPYYEKDVALYLQFTERYIQLKETQAAKESLQQVIGKIGFSDQENYRLQQLIKALYTNKISANHEVISFLNDYPVQQSWNTTSLEYQKTIGLTAVIARATYSDRFFTDGMLYQLEAYPVFTDRIYAFAEVSYSDADFFQNYGVSLSGYFGIGKGYELETGFRYLDFDTDDFFSVTIGLTKYVGRFYINTRSFLGPKIDDNFIQNYQLNLRYYLNNPEDYIFGRVGTGISPDDSSRFTQVNANPDLVAWYGTLGIYKTFRKIAGTFSVSYLNEDLTGGRTGNQLSGNLGLSYRF